MNEVAKGSSEADLIQRLRANDSNAVRQMIADYSANVRAYLAKSIGRLFSECDLDEIVQDTFIRGLRGIERFRGDSSLKTWLIRIGHNLMLNRMAYNKRRRIGLTDSLDAPLREDADATLADVTPSDADVVGGIEEEEREVGIHQSLATLRQVDRSILQMRGVQHLGYEEIAAATGINIGTVKSRLARAREKLRIAVATTEKTPPPMIAEESPTPPITSLCGCGRAATHRGRCSARRAREVPKVRPVENKEAEVGGVLMRSLGHHPEVPSVRESQTVLSDEMVALHRMTEALQNLPECRRMAVFKACGALVGLSAA